MADTIMSDRSPMSNPTDPHAGWLARRAELEASVPEDQDYPDAIGDELIRLWEQVLTTPAQTLAGMLAQVELLNWHFRGSQGCEENEVALENIAATLRRLA